MLNLSIQYILKGNFLQFLPLKHPVTQIANSFRSLLWKMILTMGANSPIMDDTVQEEQITEVVIVNIVASGRLNAELNLAAVAKDLTKLQWIKKADHSRSSGNRLLMRAKEKGG